jgi:ABC transport system ATP-binding/permease protein
MPPPLLSLRAATVRLGSQALFADLDVSIARGDRICLIGRNGCGKSTLLKALAGMVELDRGERFLQPRVSVAYLPQEPLLEPDQTALNAALGGLPGGHDRELGQHRAEAALDRLGLDPARRVGELSGGEARRLDLARILVAEADVLLLDEPTNHLDLPTIERLESELAAFPGALVIVSHDRAFLTALGRTLWWLDRGRLHALNEGFEAFDEWSGKLLEDEQAELRRLDQTIAEEAEWLRYGVTARRKRNQGRLRRLQALRRERAARVAPEGRARLAAATDASGGRLVIEAEHVGKRFGERVIVDDFSARILRGERIGIIGPNGAGKTTLLRLLTGQLAPDSGRVRLGTSLSIAYVDQRRESLDPDATPWSTLCPDGGDQVLVQGRWRHVVGYLRDFLFRPEQARSPIQALSGGERNRLLLARQLAAPCNLLVLDEPTNDLDMETLDLLQEVLGEFAGTVLLVSHDRDFLDRLVTSVLAFEGQARVREYAGGYTDSLRQRRPPPSVRPAPRRADRPRAEPPRRPQGDLDRLMSRIAALEEQVQSLERDLADPDLFRRAPADFEAKAARLEELRAELGSAEERWLELELADGA